MDSNRLQPPQQPILPTTHRPLAPRTLPLDEASRCLEQLVSLRNTEVSTLGCFIDLEVLRGEEEQRKFQRDYNNYFSPHMSFFALAVKGISDTIEMITAKFHGLGLPNSVLEIESLKALFEGAFRIQGLVPTVWDHSQAASESNRGGGAPVTDFALVERMKATHAQLVALQQGHSRSHSLRMPPWNRCVNDVRATLENTGKFP